MPGQGALGEFDVAGMHALDPLGPAEVGVDQDAAFTSWSKALALPTVLGLVVGRSLLYPPDDDVAAAVDTAVGLL